MLNSPYLHENSSAKKRKRVFSSDCDFQGHWVPFVQKYENIKFTKKYT